MCRVDCPAALPLQVDDTVKVDLATGKVVDFIKFEIGNLASITKGHNTGRVGVIQGIERYGRRPTYTVWASGLAPDP